MKYQMTLRYQKRSEYDDYMFLAGQNNDEELESYKKLKDMNAKLSEKFTTYLPIFHNDDHGVCSVRFKKDEGKDKIFKKNSMYSVDFTLKKKEYKGESYVNCFILKSKLVSKKEDSGDGEELDEL